MDERRQHERKRCDRPLRVLDLNQNNQELGLLADISVGGLMLISSSACPINRVFQLGLELPEAILGSARLEIGAESLWTESSNDRKSYWCGFHIIDIAPQDKARLVSFIDDFL